MALPIPSSDGGEVLVDGLPLDTWSTLLLMCTIATFLLGMVAKATGLLGGNAKAGETLPPYAPGSMLKHIEMITSKEYPWWILVSRAGGMSGTKNRDSIEDEQDTAEQDSAKHTHRLLQTPRRTWRRSWANAAFECLFRPV